MGERVDRAAIVGIRLDHAVQKLATSEPKIWIVGYGERHALDSEVLRPVVFTSPTQLLLEVRRHLWRPRPGPIPIVPSHAVDSRTHAYRSHRRALSSAYSVEQMIREFVGGYASCANPNQFMIVGVGLSNCLLGAGTDNLCKPDPKPSHTWVEDHGEAMADLIDDLKAWNDGNYDNNTEIRAAWDMEPGFSTFLRADEWMHGYDDNADWALIYNNTADGCFDTRVFDSAVNKNCSNGFDFERLWHLTEVHENLDYPQIYWDGSGYAKQDIQAMRIDEYGYHAHSDGLYFWGAMAGQNTANDTPQKAHADLWNELNVPPAGEHDPNHAAQDPIDYAKHCSSA